MATQESVASRSSVHPLEMLYEMGLNVIEGACSIVTLPVEYLIRPQFGTRYFNPIVVLASMAMVLVLGSAGAIERSLSPFSQPPAEPGWVGLGGMALVFWLAHLMHGARTYGRMLHMEREKHSEFEGPALPLYAWLPYGTRFWPVRIVYEPLVVLVGASAGWMTGLIDRPFWIYLCLAAVMLSVKGQLGWYKMWLHIRILMDARAAAPILAALATGNVQESQLECVHLAGFARAVPPQVKAAAVAQVRAKLPPEIERLLSPVETPAA